MSIDDLLTILLYFAPIYVLYGIGLYTISKRRNISGAWLAWVPVVNGILVGGIADHYAKVRTGKRGKLRWGTGVLSVLTVGTLSSGLVISYYTAMGGFITAALWVVSLGFWGMADDGLTPAVLICALVAILLLLAFIPIAIARLVVTIIARRNLYRSCSAEYAAVCLVAGIIFPFLNPLFIFLLRNKDEGLPSPEVPQPSAEMPI